MRKQMAAALFKSGILTAAILATTSPGWAQAPSGTSSGPISVADLQRRAMDRFNRLDINRDGKLTQEELSAGRPAGGSAAPSSAAPGGPPQAGGGGLMRGLMQSADTNQDGVITSAEFTAAINARLQQMDANHDGQISSDEMQAARSAQPAQ
jgi:Ca2+-binding EF-hand superfamily protein